VYTKPSAPRSIGGVVDDGLKLYGSAFAKSWPLALLAQVLVAVPALIIQAQFGGQRFTAGNPQAALAILKSPSVWLSYLVMMMVFLGFYNALIALLDGVAIGKTESLGRSFGAGFRLLPRTILLFVVMSLALGAVGIAGVLFVTMMTRGIGAASPIVMGIISVVFAALLVYVWGRLFLSNVALVVEDAGVFKSLGISWGLIKNHWWRTATVYTIALIIAMVFYMVIAFVNTALVGVSLQKSFGIATIIAQLVSVVGGTVLMSLIPAVLLAMYHDLKLRSEGADLAGRVNSLASR